MMADKKDKIMWIKCQDKVHKVSRGHKETCFHQMQLWQNRSLAQKLGRTSIGTLYENLHDHGADLQNFAEFLRCLGFPAFVFEQSDRK
jgi:hypothetical protein